MESSRLAPAVDFIGSVVRFPTERMLTAEDEFAKTILYRAGWRSKHSGRRAEGAFW